MRLHNTGAMTLRALRETEKTLRAAFSHYEIIVVDDGSKDDSVERVTSLFKDVPCVRLIRLARSVGPDVSLMAGLESAIGDYVVTMIADMDPPTLIPELIEQCRRENKELLLGVHTPDVVQGPM